MNKEIDATNFYETLEQVIKRLVADRDNLREEYIAYRKTQEELYETLTNLVGLSKNDLPDKLVEKITTLKKNNLPLVSIVMLSCERPEIMEQTLHSLYETTNYQNFELCILDNGSQDQKVYHILRQLEQNHKNVKIRYNPTNLGCSGGRATALEEMVSTNAKYIVTVDNDMTFSPNWLSTLVKTAETDPKIGAVSPLVVYPTHPKLKENSGKIQFNGGKLTSSQDNYFLTFVEIDSEKYQTDQNLTPAKETDWVLGGATLFRKEVMDKIKHRPDLFPNGFEDYLFSLEMTQQGWKTVSCPEAVFTHYTSSLARTLGFDTPDQNTQHKTNNRYDQIRSNIKNKWISLLNFIKETGKNPIKSWNMEPAFGCYNSKGTWTDEKIKDYFDYYTSPKQQHKPLTTYVLMGFENSQDIEQTIQELYAKTTSPLEIVIDATNLQTRKDSHNVWLMENDLIKITPQGITGTIRARWKENKPYTKEETIKHTLARRVMWTDRTVIILANNNNNNNSNYTSSDFNTNLDESIVAITTTEELDNTITELEQQISFIHSPTQQKEERHQYITQLYTQATALHKKSSIAESIIIYNKIISIDQQHKWAWYDAGIANLRIGSYAVAEKYFENIRNIDPNIQNLMNNTAENFYQKGITFEIAGNKLQAQREYRKAIVLNNQHQHAAEKLRG